MLSKSITGSYFSSNISIELFQIKSGRSRDPQLILCHKNENSHGLLIRRVPHLKFYSVWLPLIFHNEKKNWKNICSAWDITKSYCFKEADRPPQKWYSKYENVESKFRINLEYSNQHFVNTSEKRTFSKIQTFQSHVNQKLKVFWMSNVILFKCS